MATGAEEVGLDDDIGTAGVAGFETRGLGIIAVFEREAGTDATGFCIGAGIVGFWGGVGGRAGLGVTPFAGRGGRAEAAGFGIPGTAGGLGPENTGFGGLLVMSIAVHVKDCLACMVPKFRRN